MSMLRLILLMSLVCGVIYPLAVTLIGQSLFKDKANGSLITLNGKMIGSKLLGQKFERDDFFHARPSATDYTGVGSGATQFSVTHAAGKEIREQRRTRFPDQAVDAWTASASGLDPHISPETAFGQAKRVAAARGTSLEKLKQLIDRHIEGPTLGIWGQPRVNVLELNIALLAEGSHEYTGPTTSKP